MIRGLSKQEAHRRLVLYGPNVLVAKPVVTLWEKVKAIMGQPMFALLLTAATIYLVLGELEDGVALLVVVLAVVVLTYVQSQKSQNALQALRDMAQPIAIVLRDGVPHKVAAEEVVLGDLLCLMEGQQIAADARLVQVAYMEVDESLLTGESATVCKLSAEKVLAGTCVIRGEGLARVIGTGQRSAMGKIGASLLRISSITSPLQKQTERLIQNLAKVVLLICTVMWLVQGWVHGHWLSGFLAAIVLAMSLLPEEYAVVLSMFPALGAKRLATEGVLTTNIHAIETLGACTVICTDKTGTLTQNQMSPEIVVVERQKHIEQIQFQDALVSSDTANEVLRVAVLASSAQPFDAMELSLRERVNLDTAAWGKIIQSFPIRSELRVTAQAWCPNQLDKSQSIFLAAKGAPEDVMELCQLTAKSKLQWMTQVDQMAENGLRVIAVAQCEQYQFLTPQRLADHKLEWVGLIAFRDPIREEIPAALRACEQAGIRVVVITGDYPKTALAIAQQAGLNAKDCVLGDKLEALTLLELAECVRTQSVYARVSPWAKLKIVQALQAQGEVVAMVGDGVNDVIALQAADVAVAMGMRGTDVARRTAALILLNDNFGALVRGIRLGRSIFVNMQKSMSYLLAVHLPIAGLAVWPMLFNTPSVLLPLHMACLELFIDPACSVVFENEPAHATVMQVPPRDVRGALLGQSQIHTALGRGLFALAMVALSYVYAIHHTSDLMLQRTIVFVTLVVGNMMLMTSYRQHSPTRGEYFFINPRMLWLSLGAVCVTGLAVYWPVAANAFKFAPISLEAMSVAVGLGAFSALGRYLVKG